MKDKVILITGALTGIGRATALAFAHEGAHIVVSGRHDDAGNALATELHALGVEAEYIRASRSMAANWPANSRRPMNTTNSAKKLQPTRTKENK